MGFSYPSYIEYIILSNSTCTGERRPDPALGSPLPPCRLPPTDEGNRVLQESVGVGVRGEEDFNKFR
jgi:hypothetical protein